MYQNSAVVGVLPVLVPSPEIIMTKHNCFRIGCKRVPSVIMGEGGGRAEGTNHSEARDMSKYK